MLTRSQSKKMAKPELTVDIDFDEASKAWLVNKIRLQNGCYRYKPEVKRVPYPIQTRSNKDNNNEIILFS